MSGKNILGAMILAIVAVIVFALKAAEVGLWKAALAFVFASGLAGIVLLGTHLVMDDGR